MGAEEIKCRWQLDLDNVVLNAIQLTLQKVKKFIDAVIAIINF